MEQTVESEFRAILVITADGEETFECREFEIETSVFENLDGTLGMEMEETDVGVVDTFENCCADT